VSSNWKILFVMTISKSRNSEEKFCGVLLASQVKSFILFGRFPSFQTYCTVDNFTSNLSIQILSLYESDPNLINLDCLVSHLELVLETEHHARVMIQ
jgi:hypothetical protein